MQDTESGNWDEAVDLLIVGSGAGAMTSALVGHDAGASVLLIEKSDRYGGSSAMSGGGMWVPNNHLMAGVGIDDNPEDALDEAIDIVVNDATDEDDEVKVFRVDMSEAPPWPSEVWYSHHAIEDNAAERDEEED